jgi:hypothetical protein
VVRVAANIPRAVSRPLHFQLIAAPPEDGKPFPPLANEMPAISPDEETFILASPASHGLAVIFIRVERGN